jgi:hypothetical protein
MAEAHHFASGSLAADSSAPFGAGQEVPIAAFECSSPNPYRASYLGSANGLPEITVPAGGKPIGLCVGEPNVTDPADDRRLQ